MDSAKGRERKSSGLAVVGREMMMVTSLEGYDEIVTGAPICMGKVMDVNTFPGTLQAFLAPMPVAAVAAGISPASPGMMMRKESRKAPDASIAPFSRRQQPFLAVSLIRQNYPFSP